MIEKYQNATLEDLFSQSMELVPFDKVKIWVAYLKTYHLPRENTWTHLTENFNYVVFNE